MNDTNIVEEATEAATDVGNQVNQEQSKTFTQEQLDKVIEDRLGKQRRALESKYKGVDVDHYRQLTAEQEAKQLEAQKARGEFEQILKDTSIKHQQTVQSLRSELTSVKVDGALLGAANKSGAINAEQVVSLLKNQIRLGDDGKVEITDSNGQPKYTDSGDPYSVDLLVNDFIDANPHFKAATPGGANSKSNLTPNVSLGAKVDLASLDMTNPDDRRKFKEAKNKGLL
jgi:hypothetical protein